MKTQLTNSEARTWTNHSRSSTAAPIHEQEGGNIKSCERARITNLWRRHLVRVFAIVSTAFLVHTSLAAAAWAKDWPIFIQRVQIVPGAAPPDVVQGIGDGKFSEANKKGVPVNAKDPDGRRAILSGHKLDDSMIGANNEVAWGSAGYTKGVVFTNDARDDKGKRFIITGMVITAKNKGDTFKGSDGGSDFVLTPGTNKAGFATLTIEAKKGKEINPDECIWMQVPKTPDTDRKPFKGYLTGQKQPSADDSSPSSVPMPLTPSVGTSTASAMVSFTYSSGNLSFSPVDVTIAEYCDGSFSLSDDSSENMIGAGIQLDATTLLGPGGSTPGSFSFSDTSLSIAQQTDGLAVEGTLTDVLLIPDNSVPGFDSILVGNLVWGGGAIDPRSRYLMEEYSLSHNVAVFFRSNLLTVTNNLTQDGEASGPLQLSAVGGSGSCKPAF